MTNEQIMVLARRFFLVFNAETIAAIGCPARATDAPLDQVVGGHIAQRIAIVALMRHALLDGDEDPAGLVSHAANLLLADLKGEPVAVART